MVPLIKKEPVGCGSNYRGIILLSLPNKVYPRVMKRRVYLLVEPWTHVFFILVIETLDQLVILSRIFGDVWEVAQPVYMCFYGEGI